MEKMEGFKEPVAPISSIGSGTTEGISQGLRGIPATIGELTPTPTIMQTAAEKNQLGLLAGAVQFRKGETSTFPLAAGLVQVASEELKGEEGEEMVTQLQNLHTATRLQSLKEQIG